MTHSHDKNDFQQALRELRNDEPPAPELRQSAGRVWQRLQTAEALPAREMIRGCDDVRELLRAYRAGQLTAVRSLLVEAHLRECLGCRQHAEGHSSVVDWSRPPLRPAGIAWPRLAYAAALAVVAIASLLAYQAYFAVPAGPRGTLQALEGAAFRVGAEGEQQLAVGAELFEGDLMRTAAGTRAVVKLSDGSLVEVNERSEFTLQARGRDATITLDRGAVIVEAAKRQAGHLFVKTPDCRVAVTGTVFSVTSGMKGSRVSVVEGAVQVAYLDNTDLLRAGDQLSTSENLGSVPLAQDISWSRDRDRHLEVLARLGALQRQLEQVQLPAPRYSSRLLERMPADAAVYASLPNAGQALEEAHRILQQQIAQSPALRRWWADGRPETQARMDQMITKVRRLSDYLGEEVLLIGFAGKNSSGAVVAEVTDRGLKDFLRAEFANKDNKLTVVTPEQLGSLPAQSRDPVALVREHEVIFSENGYALARINRQLDGGGPGLAQTEFGRRLTEAYSRGAGFLLAADLQSLNRQSDRQRKTAQLAGFDNMRYLIAEHRDLNGVPENRLVLDFAGPRRGISSWLGAPAPMGSLEFISRHAALALAGVGKEPEAMLADLLAMSARGSRATQDLSDFETKMNLRLREDLAAHFGGSAAFALDGPVVPTPSWKFILEVNNAPALAASLERLVQGIDSEAQAHGKPGVELRREEVSGQSFYELRRRDGQGEVLHYTFASGYMLVGPSRALLMGAIRTRETGDSLARSAAFKGLLPRDDNPNYSAIAYQNLAPILQPLLDQLSGERAEAVRQLAADSRPSVICAWGTEDRIEAVSTSRLTPFDWFALAQLIDMGTARRRSP
jgi:hypothetical protein